MPVFFILSVAGQPQAKLEVPFKDTSYWLKRPDNGAVFVLKPKLDRLSFVVDLEPQDTPEEAKGYLIAMMEGDEAPLATTNKTKSHQYEINAFVKNFSLPNTCLIQASPRSDNAAKRFFRFELSGEMLSAKSIASFADFVSNYLFSGHGFAHVRKTAKITRFDVAVDIVNLSLDEVLLVSHLEGKSIKYVGADSKLETVYVGKKTKSSPAYVYDKKKQLQKDDLSASFGNASHIRVERRVMTNSSFNGLTAAKNPLHSLSLLDVAAIPPPGPPHIWNWFCDSCKERGIEGALVLAPKNEQKVYQSALASAEHKLWRPKQLWESWPEHIKAMGLAG
jgi:hypothetical protein